MSPLKTQHGAWCMSDVAGMFRLNAEARCPLLQVGLQDASRWESLLLCPPASPGPGHGTEAALCAHATGPHAHSPGRKGAPRGASAAPGAGTAPQLPGRCEDSSRVRGTHRMRPRGLWPRCPNGPREQQDAGVPRTPTTRGGRGGRCSRRAVHPTAPGRPGPGEAPLWPPLCPAPAEARGGHRVRPHPARGRGQRGRVEDVGAGGPVTPLPRRRPSEAEGLRPSVTRDGEITHPDRPCGQKREPVLEPGVSAECPGWSGRGREPPREDGPPGGSGPGPQGHGHHCSHTACTSPGPWAARARACRAAGPPTAACTILAARPGLR